MTVAETKPTADLARLKLVLRGAVQGVGFRPFVYRLANELGLTGWVNNSPQGVLIEVEGARATLEQFRTRLAAEKPPRSFIQSCEAAWLDAVGCDGFTIRDSETSGGKSALVLPDIATCPDCLREILDPTNRRHRYPFTNCTNCGPRFSIIEALPYDRASTSMRGFTMCPACQAEYNDPGNRRFHAQPNACPNCGPHLELWEGSASVPAQPLPLARDHVAMLVAVEAIRRGLIVAAKGIGGFHLLVDARNAGAVRRLRERKHREEKPFALMFPTLASVKEVCEVSPLEESLLQSPEAPIVLLRRLSTINHQLSTVLAPGNPNLGVMLPSNPLPHLLMAELGFPVVATSGNLSDEPICTDEFEALERLRGIADVFLVHNRPIVRHVDDSITRVMLGREMVLRRARGYAPLPVTVAAGILPAVEPGFQPGGNSVVSSTVSGNSEAPFVACAGPGGKMPPATAGRMPAATVLAVGAHLKNSVALAVGEQVFLSQHIGDLETEQANSAFRRVAADLPRLYEAQPGIIAADLHPDYLSTQFALEQAGSSGFNRSGPPEGGTPNERPRVIRVQHHIAHVLSCMAENEVKVPALGVAWDGTGLGTDGTIWGGEFFLVTDAFVERVAHWRPFRLPGGDAAAKEPRRAALGLLYELLGEAAFERRELATVAAFTEAERAGLQTMLTRALNAPWCCSVGRLFDVVASLLNVRQQMRFEGQAAMALEFAAEAISTDKAYGLRITDGGGGLMQLDWTDLMLGILVDAAKGVSVGEISAKFHNMLAENIITVAKRVGCERVALSGGCFQNRYLTERAITRLRAEGLQPYWHQRVPTNDGGIALGQVVAAQRELSIRGAAFTPLLQPECELYSSPSATLKRPEACAPLQPLTQHESP